MIKFALALAAPVLLVVAPAAAVTIDLSTSLVNNDVQFYVVDRPFVLPAGATNVTLDITRLLADDRVVAQLNGINLLGAGIFGPGNGRFLFDAAGPAVDFVFSGNGAQSFSTTTGFLTGANVLRLIVNNTGSGIFGDTLTGGPSQVDFAGSVTFDLAPVPAPAAIALFGLGVVALGVARRR